MVQRELIICGTGEKMIKITDLTHKLIKEKTSINIAVDMTVGWGNDTLVLVSNSEFVYGFDIQKKALDKADILLKENGFANYQLINENHEFILNHIDQKIDLCLYNLGYLPKGDKTIFTEATSTINSLKSVMTLLNEDGLIILVVYSHNKQEKENLFSFCKTLSSEYDVMYYQVMNKENCPELITIKKVV